ncbi:unnamed protein product, partial [marine sediment metagenome]
KRILEVARIAPSATNAQPWRFIVVRKKQVREKLKAAYSRPWFWTAPVVICACGITSEAWRRSDGKSYLDVDVAIAMDHLILAATAEGLGTCWIGAFEPFEIKRILNLPLDLSSINAPTLVLTRLENSSAVEAAAFLVSCDISI